MQNIVSYKGNLLLSGGASGSDTVWGLFALALKHDVIHWSFKEHKCDEYSKSRSVILDQNQLDQADDALKKANRSLKRRFPASNQYTNNLLRRNFYQVRWASHLYGIGMFESSGLVKGGTAWAVQMFIDRMHTEGKELYLWFFDQEHKKWFTYHKGNWSEIRTPPVPSGVYAGIGTRDITEDGEMAIENLYENIGYKVIRTVPEIGQIIYVPDIKKPGFGVDNKSGGWAKVRKVLKADNCHYVNVYEHSNNRMFPWETKLKNDQLVLKCLYGWRQAGHQPDLNPENNVEVPYRVY